MACLLLVVGTWAGYEALGTDFLPRMDEGGFILDYIMPAGSSLSETNRVLEHVERILHATLEVEITSRRTGLQLGLRCCHRGQHRRLHGKAQGQAQPFGVGRNGRRRAEAKEHRAGAGHRVFQILQDNINDLSNAPEPVQIKIYSNDEQLLDQVGPRVADAITKIPGVVDVENGIDNTVSGPATNFQVDPSVASRLGFTPLRRPRMRPRFSTASPRPRR